MFRIQPQRIFEHYEKRCAGEDRWGFTFCVSGKTTSVSWAQMFDEADDVGATLSEHVPKHHADGIVAILTSSQQDQVRFVLGALRAGLAPAVLTPPNRKLERHYYLKTMRAVLQQTSPALLISDLDEDVLAVIDDTERPYELLNLTGESLLDRTVTGKYTRVPDDTALVQFSSGTTGIKKGVAISDYALLSQLESYSYALDVKPTLTTDGKRTVEGDCIASWLPLYHDMGYVTAIHLALHNQVHVAMLDPIEWVGKPDLYLDAVETFGSTLGWHPNFAYAFMAKRCSLGIEEQVDLKSLRALTNCSEPVTDAAQSAFFNRFERSGLNKGVFAGCYAMAETTFAVTHSFGSDINDKDLVGPSNGGSLASRLPLVTVGQSLNNVQIEIRDEHGRTLPERTIGEIFVKAPFLATEYLTEPSNESRAFVDGWYKTGDLGYALNGSYFVTGRSKDMLIVAGHNVFPEDIERIISDSEGIQHGRVAAFAVPDERFQTEQVVAVAEKSRDGKTAEVSHIRQQLMAAVNVAVNIEIVEPGTLVKSSSGKISRSEVAKRWQAKRNGETVRSV